MDAVKVKTDVCYFSLQQHSETKSKLLFFMFMSERTIKLNMREGGWRGNCTECHRERMKRSPVLNSNPQTKAHNS